MKPLAARLASGEEAAFAELYDACADRLHHYVAVRLGSRDAASDVVQNSFLKAVKSRRQFRDVDNPAAYMFQIARNEAIRAAQKQRRWRQLPSDESCFATSSLCADDGDAEVVSAAIERLNAGDREVVELKIFGGLTFREIAEVTGLPTGTVATRYRRSLGSLRGWLEKQFR